MTYKEIFGWIVQIVFGGGIIVYIYQLFRERRLKKKDKNITIKAIHELFLEEVKKNLFVFKNIERTCEIKKLNPEETLESKGLFFNVINYILVNLIELNITKNQFSKLMEIKTALENVLFWQDEYINGTKGNPELMYNKKIIDYYIPRIESAVQKAKELMINENLFCKL